jgi:hypothetical protein
MMNWNLVESEREMVITVVLSVSQNPKSFWEAFHEVRRTARTAPIVVVNESRELWNLEFFRREGATLLQNSSKEWDWTPKPQAAQWQSALDYICEYKLGDWLCFLQPGASLPPGWMETAKGTIARGTLNSIYAGLDVFMGVAGDMLHPQWIGHGRRPLWWKKLPDSLELMVAEPFAGPPVCVEEAFNVPIASGAALFIGRHWLEHLGGFPPFFGTGQIEMCLSLSTWLAGGYCSCLPHLAIGRRPLADLEAWSSRIQIACDKLRCAQLLFPADTFEAYLERLPEFPEIRQALALLDQEEKERERQRLPLPAWAHLPFAYLNTLEWLCSKWDLDHPADFHPQQWQDPKAPFDNPFLPAVPAVDGPPPAHPEDKTTPGG